MKYLICGLGNFGIEYELTRHNVGFLLLDRFAEVQHVDFQTKRYVNKAECKIKGRTLHLIKPNTYMNLSGKAVLYWMSELNVSIENVLILVDDFALPFGELRLRAKGSSAGHNGLKNIELLVNTQQYARLRIGIGNDFPRGGQVNYVLSNFTPDELKSLPPILDKGSDIITSFCTLGVERTMNLFTKKQED